MPARRGQANIYAYVGNDPVNWADPTGTDASYTPAPPALMGCTPKPDCHLKNQGRCGEQYKKCDDGRVNHSCHVCCSKAKNNCDVCDENNPASPGIDFGSCRYLNQKGN